MDRIVRNSTLKNSKQIYIICLLTNQNQKTKYITSFSKISLSTEKEKTEKTAAGQGRRT